MNPVFWLLILLIGFLVWVLLSAIFIPLGKLIYCKWKRIDENINKECEEEKEK